METLKAIANRKSIRSYKAQDVEKSKIETIIGAANKAPTAGPVHITVISNRVILKNLNDKTLKLMHSSGNDFLQSRAAIQGYQPMYHAPVMLVFSGPKDNHYSMANASNAATMASLAATDLGLGSCYVVTPTMTLAAEPDLAHELGVPKGFFAGCCLLLGYTDDASLYATNRVPEDNVNYYE